MSKSTDYYTTRNLSAWDEVAPRHAKINASLERKVTGPGFNNLNPDFDRLIDSLNPAGKSVVQVCCNNATELLSVRNKGAGRCLGIDGSAAFLGQAERFAGIAGHADIEFCCTDVYDLPQRYRQSFDIAMITVGVLCWMPDLPRFFEIVASLLADGGHLVVEEIHPVLYMYEEGNPSYLACSYFDTEPCVDSDGLDYYSHEKYAALENYSFLHRLSDILMAALASGLRLEYVKELPYNVGNYCEDLEFVAHNPPLGIVFCWQKLP